MKDASTSLVVRMGNRYGVEPAAVYDSLRKTIVRTDNASDAQVMALMLVADQYNLNPFTKEIYAYPDKRGGIVPVVGVDGWVRIVQEQPAFDGFGPFLWDAKEGAMTCTIYRKDRSHPTEVTEYLNECRRKTDAWDTAPRRMMRHRALMQCARLAFGFAGIHDDDEALGIVSPEAKPNAAHDALAAAVRSTKPADLPMVEEVQPASAPAAAVPPDVPESGTLERYLHVIYGDDELSTQEALSDAREALSDEDFKSLMAAYRSRSTTTYEGQQDGN